MRSKYQHIKFLFGFKHLCNLTVIKVIYQKTIYMPKHAVKKTISSAVSCHTAVLFIFWVLAFSGIKYSVFVSSMQKHENFAYKLYIYMHMYLCCIYNS